MTGRKEHTGQKKGQGTRIHPAFLTKFEKLAQYKQTNIACQPLLDISKKRALDFLFKSCQFILKVATLLAICSPKIKQIRIFQYY